MSELLAAFQALPDSIAMLIVFVLAGLFHSCSGYVRTIFAVLSGSPHGKLDLRKMRNAAFMGLAFGLIGWVGVELQIEPFASIEIANHTDFGLMFTAAFTAIFIVHRFTLGPIEAAKKATPRPPAGVPPQ